MESDFIFIRNFSKDSYEIFWKNTQVKNSHHWLHQQYSQENPESSFGVVGGGKLVMMLDKKTFVFFGNSPFGQFNLELLNSIAREKFPTWTIITNPFEDSLKSALDSWHKCKFQYQIFENAYDKSVYSLRLDTGQEVESAYPVTGKFLDTSNGEFIDISRVHEIKRISHKSSKVK